MTIRKLLATTFAIFAILAFAGVASAAHHEKGEGETANPCGDAKADNPCGGEEANPCGDAKADNPCGGEEANPCGDAKAED